MPHRQKRAPCRISIIVHLTLLLGVWTLAANAAVATTTTTTQTGSTSHSSVSWTMSRSPTRSRKSLTLSSSSRTLTQMSDGGRSTSRTLAPSTTITTKTQLLKTRSVLELSADRTSSTSESLPSLSVVVESHTDCRNTATRRSPTPSARNHSDSMSHGEHSLSSSITPRELIYRGPCELAVSVGPDAAQFTVPFGGLPSGLGSSASLTAADDSQQAPSSLPPIDSDAVTYYSISALTMLTEGLRILVNVQPPAGYVDPIPFNMPTLSRDAQDDIPRNIFVLSVKDGLYYPMVGSAEYVTTQSLWNLHNSSEEHGVMGEIMRNRAQVLVSLTSNHSLEIVLSNFSSYRIAVDEWLALNFYNTSTTPLGCAAAYSIVIRVQAVQPSVLQPAIDAICIAALAIGLAAATTGHPLLLSQHAGSVVILSLLHMAQTDGSPLPLALNLFQAEIGQPTDKYRFVVGALVVNATLVAGIALVHYLAACYLVPAILGMAPATSQGVLKHPFMTVAVALHFAPGVWYCFGRNLGNQNLAQYVVDLFAAAAVSSVTWIGFKRLVSASMSVRFQEHKDKLGQLIRNGFGDEMIQAIRSGGGPGMGGALADGVDDGCVGISAERLELEGSLNMLAHRPHAELLVSGTRGWPRWLRSLLLWLDEERGEWRAIDSQGIFMESHGYVLYNYTKRGRWWMGVEQLDIFVVSLLTLVDNYNLTLALVQFGITFFVKLCAFLVMLSWDPPRKSFGGVLLKLMMLFELLVTLALLLGAVSMRLIAFASVVQSVCCLLAACVMLLEAVGVTAHSCCCSLLHLRKHRATAMSVADRDTVVQRCTRKLQPLDLWREELTEEPLGLETGRGQPAAAAARDGATEDRSGEQEMEEHLGGRSSRTQARGDRRRTVVDGATTGVIGGRRGSTTQGKEALPLNLEANEGVPFPASSSSCSGVGGVIGALEGPAIDEDIIDLVEGFAVVARSQRKDDVVAHLLDETGVSMEGDATGSGSPSCF